MRGNNARNSSMATRCEPRKVTQNRLTRYGSIKHDLQATRRRAEQMTGTRYVARTLKRCVITQQGHSSVMPFPHQSENDRKDGKYGKHAYCRDEQMYARRPTECVSPKIPRGASALSRPRRIFSSLGKGGKNKGGGGWPGRVKSGILGGADVNALRLCA